MFVYLLRVWCSQCKWLLEFGVCNANVYSSLFWTYQCQAHAKGKVGSGVRWGFWHFLKNVVKTPISRAKNINIKNPHPGAREGSYVPFSLCCTQEHFLTLPIIQDGDHANPHPTDLGHTQIPVDCPTLGKSRLCSATFEQLFLVLNFEQLLIFWATFDQIKSFENARVKNLIENFNLNEFLCVYQVLIKQPVSLSLDKIFHACCDPYLYHQTMNCRDLPNRRSEAGTSCCDSPTAVLLPWIWDW